MRLGISIFIFCFTLASYAQAIPEEEDVKVGLVLSGGGAKGLAHLGVLKVIEESGVRVDYIAGTSMGAIVGGLYAAGYSSEQLDSIVSRIDFDRIIQDDLPRRAKTFYEKEDAERYALTLPFDNFKLSLPQSLSKGQNTYNLLARTLDHVSDVEDFKELPIPFFCIATDIEKGEQVLLENGYLPDAIGASGALPSLFSPIELNGRVLIDGGVVNNYPIEELKAKGMDIIIGVDVQDALRNRENLSSAPEVLLQINNMRTVRAMETKRGQTDVYIRPDISAFTVVSFDDAQKIISEGESKAREQLEVLEEIAGRQSTLSRKRTIAIPTPKDSISIDAIAISGNNRYTRAYVRGKLKLSPPEKVSYEDFTEGINNLTATGNFDRIGYKFLGERDEKVLSLRLKETKSTQSIRLGLHYDDLFRSAGLVNFTKKSLLFENDITSLDVVLGDNLRYDFNYYIDKGFYWSVGLSSTYFSFEKGVSARLVEQVTDVDLATLSRVTLDYQDLTNKLYFRTLFAKDFSLDLGVKHQFLDVETETVEDDDIDQPGFVFEKSHFAGAFGQIKYDSLDNKFFPSSGVYFDGDFDLYLYSSDFNQDFTEFSIANMEFLYAQKIASSLTGRIGLEGGFKIGGADINSLDFFLGGFGNKKVNNIVPFYGYDFLSITGDGYVKADFALDYEIFKKNHLSLAANFANAGLNIFTSEKFLPPPEYSGYAIGYGLETILGPIELKYSFSPEVDVGEWFVRVGFSF